LSKIWLGESWKHKLFGKKKTKKKQLKGMNFVLWAVMVTRIADLESVQDLSCLYFSFFLGIFNVQVLTFFDLDCLNYGLPNLDS